MISAFQCNSIDVTSNLHLKNPFSDVIFVTKVMDICIDWDLWRIKGVM